MEYLMTYGWAILIIAVVLGVLFQLGVFSGSALTPKAQPGSCLVLRIAGQVSLEGECQGQLPQYVAYFNGQTSYIGLPVAAQITGNQFTVVLWADVLGNGANPPRGIMFSQRDTYIDACVNTGSGAYFQIANTLPSYPSIASPPCAPVGTWEQYAGTYNGVAITFYINGVQRGPTAYAAGNLESGSGYPLDIGSYFGESCCSINGEVADVQLYNTSLSANEVKALYLEGIGGAPIKIQNLAGWWPLNGNAQDYSGNNNNGQIIGGVSFNGSWQSSYTAP
jgi:hypothetical protein